MVPALDTLFLPLTQEIIASPRDTALFLGARPHPALANLTAHCMQHFYPWARGLPQNPPQESYPLALALIAKSTEEAQGQLATALNSLSPGGVLISAAANNANGNRLEKWFQEAGLTPQSLSKNKCRVVWAVKGEAAIIPKDWIAYAKPRRIELDGHAYLTQAGLFGFDKIDAGSKLLAAHLPDDITGHIADFGCGYGYLAVQALQKNGGIEAIDVIDADARAIQCAQANCAAVASVPVNSVWADLTQAFDQKYDAILMNPPFHDGKSSDADIGLAFIASAAASLKKGGQLFMVANRHLPYEKTLAAHFLAVEKSAEEAGFKVFTAVKG